VARVQRNGAVIQWLVLKPNSPLPNNIKRTADGSVGNRAGGQNRRRWRVLGFAVALALLLLLAGVATRDYWSLQIGNSLVHPGHVQASDVLLVENLNIEYLLFERAERLRRQGMGRRIVVPVEVRRETDEPEALARRITELICEMARIQDAELVPVVIEEPISIGVARQLAEKFRAEGVESVIVVTSGFRSRRTYLIYDSVMSPLGIRVYCSPVFGVRDGPDKWTETWHGIQKVIEQFVKLQYYRWAVL
jgi:phenylpyruvate tautomerase PptA (4-oxalocrotonate tautomerase family)